MSQRTLGPDDAAHTLMSFLRDWAASDRGTSYSAQAPSGSFRQMEFCFPHDGGDLASLELIAGSEDGHPVIQIRVSNYDPFACGTANPRYPTWQVALESSRRVLSGPMSQSLFAPEAAAMRHQIAMDFRKGIAGLPNPMPSEMLEFLRKLEGSVP